LADLSIEALFNDESDKSSDYSFALVDFATMSGKKETASSAGSGQVLDVTIPTTSL